jgi:Ras GTPase-activating-like protein IQGAP2/3
LKSIIRRGPGQSYIKDVLSNRINVILEQTTLDLEINPLKVRQMLVETASAEEQARLNAVKPDELHKDPAIAAIIGPRLSKLSELANGFLTDIIASLDRVPYGIKWICKQIKSLTKVRSCVFVL